MGEVPPELTVCVSETERLLAEIIHLPQSLIKLLARPPVKLVRDVFVAVATTTGCGQGLFTEEELQDALSTRENKLAFASALLHFVSSAVGEPGLLELVHADRICSGQEPEKTNLLFQKMHHAATGPGCQRRWPSAVQAARIVFQNALPQQPGLQGAATEPVKTEPNELHPPPSRSISSPALGCPARRRPQTGKRHGGDHRPRSAAGQGNKCTALALAPMQGKRRSTSERPCSASGIGSQPMPVSPKFCARPDNPMIERRVKFDAMKDVMMELAGENEDLKMENGVLRQQNHNIQNRIAQDEVSKRDVAGEIRELKLEWTHLALENKNLRMTQAGVSDQRLIEENKILRQQLEAGGASTECIRCCEQAASQKIEARLGRPLANLEITKSLEKRASILQAEKAALESALEKEAGALAAQRQLAEQLGSDNKLLHDTVSSMRKELQKLQKSHEEQKEAKHGKSKLQGEIEHIKSERAQLQQKVEALSKASERAQATNAERQQELEKLRKEQQKLTRQLDEVRKAAKEESTRQLEEMQEKQEELHKANDKLRKANEKLQNSSEEYKMELEEMQGMRDQLQKEGHDKLKHQFEVAQRATEEMQQMRAEQHELRGRLEEADKIKEGAEKAKEELEQLRTERDQLRAQAKELEDAKEAARSEAEGQLSALQDGAEKAKEELEQLRMERDELRAQAKELEVAKEAARSETEGKLRALQAAHEQLGVQVDALQEAKEAMRSQLDDLQQAKEAAETARDQVAEQLEAELSKIRGERDHLADENQELQAAVQKQEGAEKVKEELEQLRTEQDAGELKEAVARAEALTAENKSLKESFQSVNNDLRGLISLHEIEEKELRELRGTVQQLREEKDELEAKLAVADESDAEGGSKSPVGRAKKARVQAGPAPAELLDGGIAAVHPERGISVSHLAGQFLADVEAAGLSRDADVYEVERLVILPRCADATCPHDGQRGAALVDGLAGSPAVGPTSFMVSYSWSFPIGDVVDGLLDFCRGAGLAPEATFVWMCCFCTNRHRRYQEGAFVEQVQSLVESSKHVLALVTPWESPRSIGRVWCNYEMHVAASAEDCRLSIAMPPKELEKLHKALLSDRGIINLWEAIHSVNISEASSSLAADKTQILQSLQDHQVDPEEVSSGVAEQLQQWVVAACTKYLTEQLKARSLSSKELAVMCTSVGHILLLSQDQSRAAWCFQKALKFRERDGSLDSPGAATLHRRLGEVRQEGEDWPGAIEAYERARGIMERGAGGGGASSLLEAEAGVELLRNLAGAKSKVGDAEGTLEAFELACQCAERCGRLETAECAQMLVSVGSGRRAKGDNAGALEALDKAWSIFQLVGDTRQFTLLEFIGVVRLATGDTSGANSAFEEALKLREQKKEDMETQEAARVLVNVGSLRSAGGDHAGALRAYEAAKVALEAAGQLATPQGAQVLTTLGTGRFACGDRDGALEVFETAKQAYATHGLLEDPAAVSCQQWMDFLNAAAGDESPEG